MRLLAFLLDFAVIALLASLALRILGGFFFPRGSSEFHTWKEELKHLNSERIAALFHGNYDQANNLEARILAHKELKPDVPFWAFWIR